MENTYERKINKYIYAAVIMLGGLVVASAWYMRADAVTEGCPELMPGDLFKVPNHSAVYLLNDNKRRMYFPHESVYFTWYRDFSNIKVIANICIDDYPSPGERPLGVNYRGGSYLIKTVLSPSVYAIEPGGRIRKIVDESVAAALYGSNWKSEVRDLPDVFWANYEQLNTPIVAPFPHDGMLIRLSGTTQVYFVTNSNKYKVVSGLNEQLQLSVQTVDASVYDAVPTSTSTVTGSLITKFPAIGMHGTIE